MKRFLLYILLFLCGRGVFAQEKADVLPAFDRLRESDGLYSDNILHILELADGRMAITNDSCVNIYDGKEVVQHHVSSPDVHHLSNYKGFYHVYADDNDFLWVKNFGTVWCMDLKTGENVDLHHMEMTDMFVDSRHQFWLVNDTVVGSRFKYEREWGELQDLDADSLNLYLFFSTSKLACYDKSSAELKYITQPYDTAEAKYYDKTSLVVKGKDNCFYQLRCGKERFIFLKYSPEEQMWNTIFETNTGIFHTLCIPDENLALISCPQGLWEINLKTGEMKLRAMVTTTDGEQLRTGFNSVFCDHLGRLWLGTYNDGVLYADAIHAPQSHTALYVICALVLLVIVLIVVFRKYAIRQRRREHRLMIRLRQLTMTAINADHVSDVGSDMPSNAESEDSDKADASENTVVPEPESAENSEFVMKAVALVKKNINTPGYSVERLASDLCMERTGLYKKLTAMLDKTPTLFIRSIRLEQAAQMLKEGNKSIADIAEQTGFSSPSYFSKQFQQAYGCKPSEYADSGK